MEKNELATTPEKNYLGSFDNMQSLCKKLLQTPHYKKIGEEGIFAIVQTARSLGVDPLQALGGGLYFVKGKVEMSARMMGALIRARKHSVKRDSKSNNTICILHGKRFDTGDEWSESFSLDEAEKAGLTRNPVWKNFTRDMLYARALSRLARQLFPDVIGNCYVEGELSYDQNIAPEQKEERISEFQVNDLKELLAQVPKYREQVNKHMRGKKAEDLTIKEYNKLRTTALSRLKDQELSNVEEVEHVSA